MNCMETFFRFMGLLLRVALAAKMDVAFNSIDMRMCSDRGCRAVFDPDADPLAWSSR